MPKYPGKCPDFREADLYSGCPFGCVYCIAKGEHSPVVVPSNAELELISGPCSRVPLYLSPWTDPYPPCEENEFRTGNLVRHLSTTGQPFYIVTKSLLVKRDAGVIRDGNRSFLALSLNTLDERIVTMLEPGAPGAGERAELIRELAGLPGLKTVVRVDPILPGITDGERLRELLRWILGIKPFAIAVETLRMDSFIASRLQEALPSHWFNALMAHYPPPEGTPVHPHREWRTALFSEIAGLFTGSGVRACFCRATVPEAITPWDCRGGY
jgi:DNA repair photolyase